VAEALGDLHGVGLAHGDIKPANVLVDAEGRAHLIDLGLACAMHARSVEGATPRYLALGDRELGDARARDLLGLGVILAERVDPSVAQAGQPLVAARAAGLPEPLRGICAALLSPNPGGRPSAAWVVESARAALLRAGDSAMSSALGEADRSERHARQVRATYLRLRRAEMGVCLSASDDTAPWLAQALERAARARAIGGDGATGGGGALPGNSAAGAAEQLGPLDAQRRARWLTALVGSAVASWSMEALAGVSERVLSQALVLLARRLPPAAWRYADVEAAIGAAEGRHAAAAAALRSEQAGGIDAAESARLALAIARVPPDAMALARIEQQPEAPIPLVLAAADALRLSGEYGRARSLLLGERARSAKGAAAPAAEVLRRSGDMGLAKEYAREAIALGEDDEGRARAVLARIALDEGDLDQAEGLVRDASTAALSEVAARVAAARGDSRRALAEVARGETLARDAEQRARFAALRGYVVGHGTDPAASHAAYASAVDYAVRAGAVVEEATYRTGEAAAAVDLGDLGSAVSTSRRAALLWEHLGQPALAARALLACAAAFATAGAAHDTVLVAREAIARARDGADRRAEAYAHWAIADVAPVGSEEGRHAANRAAAILNLAVVSGEPSASPSPQQAEEELRGAARVLRHESRALDAALLARLDRLAGEDRVSAFARLEWWGARATDLLAGRGDRSESRVLAALTALADARAPVASRGPALAAGCELAAREGLGDVAQRLLVSLGELARDLIRRAPADLVDAVRSLPWVSRAAALPDAGIRPEQARDLEVLIGSLGEREHLKTLLNRVVDALVLWTGVERGLLLLRAPDGRLVPRTGRHLGRSNLTKEQLALSQTLAKQALDAREPVVAVDAAGELSSVHQSVHALKLRSVLALPLVARGEVLGVVYLDDRVRRGAFGARELSWARTVASLAALAIADARDQVLLKRAARKDRRNSIKLEELLAHSEAALDAAERELSKARGSRATRFRYDAIAGESEPIRAMLKVVDRVTTTDVPVFIHGESGSGKELVARAIHNNGARSARPFVSENCSAIPEGLLESTLFGHVRGAYTGAERPRVGLFETADRGTLFLDEIGEMSLAMQAKLLRVLEDGMVRPLGSEQSRKVNVRIIAATHRDIDMMVKEGRFREDLLYRLNIITIRIPPLRDRPGDVALLVHHFLRKYGADGKRRVARSAMDRLAVCSWPGNVRQLENEIRRALILSDGMIDLEHLSAEVRSPAGATAADVGLLVRPRVDALEQELVREALSRTKGNQTQAAKLLGLSRFGLQKMMKRLSIA
jgi:transcriptional regulator with GAF, ATPase, and Fis domain